MEIRLDEVAHEEAGANGWLGAGGSGGFRGWKNDASGDSSEEPRR